MPCAPYKDANYYVNMYFQLCVSNNGTQVDVSIEPTEYSGLSDGSRSNWRMQLQRKQSTGIYETIGTREGYVSVTSPSYRTFTNVKSGSDDMRIYLLYYEDDIDNIVEFYRP